jgi:hypothetical protein
MTKERDWPFLFGMYSTKSGTNFDIGTTNVYGSSVRKYSYSLLVQLSKTKPEEEILITYSLLFGHVVDILDGFPAGFSAVM